MNGERNSKEICEFLKNTRIKKHLSQKELADKLQTSDTQVSKIENGDRKRLDYDLLKEYAKALDVTIGDIIYSDFDASKEEVDFVEVKTPSIGITISSAIAFLTCMILNVIAFLVKNKQFTDIIVFISVAIVIVAIGLFLMQIFTVDNKRIIPIRKNNKMEYKYFGKREIVSFWLYEIIMAVLILFGFALSSQTSIDIGLTLVLIVGLIFGILKLVLAMNVLKKNSKTSGFGFFSIETIQFIIYLVYFEICSYSLEIAANLDAVRKVGFWLNVVALVYMSLIYMNNTISLNRRVGK